MHGESRIRNAFVLAGGAARILHLSLLPAIGLRLHPFDFRRLSSWA
jgi:hypothetical protein